ncbi:hypothetical protein Omen_058 [Erwinia phage Omen]|uniref:Uncharacterized protein n=1 Tax=Erwinia phage Harbringer TaxID=3158978 RepID=A0AAU8EJC8_9CAUD
MRVRVSLPLGSWEAAFESYLKCLSEEFLSMFRHTGSCGFLCGAGRHLFPDCR